MNVLEVRGLTKVYPKFTLSDLSFSVREGSVMGFIGRNGAGKTTTLISMLGLVPPDGGSVRIRRIFVFKKIFIFFVKNY